MLVQELNTANSSALLQPVHSVCISSEHFIHSVFNAESEAERIWKINQYLAILLARVK